MSDARSKYEWKGDFDSNAILLKDIQKNLEASVNDLGRFNHFTIAAKSLMKWGGTGRGNNDWLENPNNLLVVHETIKLLEKNTDDIEQMKLIPDFRFNFGLAKLYSLLIKDFIIYDSRVAGALSWFVYKFVNGNPIPEELKFLCMTSRYSKNIGRYHLRRASDNFPIRANNNDALHANWNIRASWLLSKASDTLSQSEYFSRKNVGSLRSLEAALFMWGYDLHDSL